MYEEPYRWVEAVGNRRQYLDEQFRQGSPVVALSFREGVLLMTVSKGTPKLYEIYDRIGLGGMGHPADLEKLRFSLLEMAHLEGFNRSPSDVTGSRLMKHGLAPVIKQAFEEIYKAPYIVKVLLAEIGSKSGRDAFLTVNYDGTFEEVSRGAVLAATQAIQREMMDALLTQEALAEADLPRAFEVALLIWAIGSTRQGREDNVEVLESPGAGGGVSSASERKALVAHLREVLNDRTNVECAVLERKLPGTSKYRSVKADEIVSLMPADLKT